jgi:hypothetical protein
MMQINKYKLLQTLVVVCIISVKSFSQGTIAFKIRTSLQAGISRLGYSENRQPYVDYNKSFDYQYKYFGFTDMLTGLASLSLDYTRKKSIYTIGWTRNYGRNGIAITIINYRSIAGWIGAGYDFGYAYQIYSSTKGKIEKRIKYIQKYMHV